MGFLKLISWQVKLGIAIALLAIMGSLYYAGYSKGKNISAVEIAQYEGKVKDLNAKLATNQAKIDVRTVVEYKDKVVYIDRIKTQTRDVIRTSVPEQFTFSKGWVYAYNQSALGLEVDPVKAADKTPSTTSDMKALSETIAPNNSKYLIVKQRLDSLQKWERDSQKIAEEAK